MISPPVQPPPSPSKPLVQQPLSSMSTLLRKRQSAYEEKPEPQKEDSIAPRPGSVQERLQKLNGRDTAPILNMAIVANSNSSSKSNETKDSPKTEEPKKGKILPITTESKTVTTTLTSTSTKTRKANVEKKVQHVSEGKCVEEVERTCTEQDEVSVTKVRFKIVSVTN
ncbi:hypothetical protein COOONC_04297 [Cooperia oncophora]